MYYRSCHQWVWACSSCSSGVSCVLEILILIFTGLTFIKNISTIVEPLNFLPPISHRNLEATEQIPITNFTIKQKTSFLQRQRLLQPMEQCTEEKKEIYNSYIGEQNILKVLQTLKYNEDKNYTVFIISSFTIGFNLFFWCIFSFCFVPCFLNKNDPAGSCCLLIQSSFLLLTIIGSSIAMAKCSSSAMHKIRDELPLIPIECAKNVQAFQVISDFNDYRNGFQLRNIAVLVLASIIFGANSLVIICSYCFGTFFGYHDEMY